MTTKSTSAFNNKSKRITSDGNSFRQINTGSITKTEENNDRLITTNIKRNLVTTKTMSMPSSPNSSRHTQERHNINTNNFLDDDGRTVCNVANNDSNRDEKDKQKFPGDTHHETNPQQKYLVPVSIMINSKNKTMTKSLPIFSKLDKKCSTSEPDIMIMKRQNYTKSKIKPSNSDCGYTAPVIAVNNSRSDNNIIMVQENQLRLQQPSESKSDGQISSLSAAEIVNIDIGHKKVCTTMILF